MERKYKMDSFLRKVKRETADVDGDLFYVEDVDNEDRIYLGFTAFYENSAFTYYLMPVDDDTALIFLYFGTDTTEAFDKIVPSINKRNYGGIQNAFPYFIDALNNGVNDRYSYPALIKLKDFSNSQGKSFWCMSQMVENVDFENLASKYIVKKAVMLLDYTTDMFEQLANNNVSTWDKTKEGWSYVKDFLKIKNTIDLALRVFGF